MPSRPAPLALLATLLAMACASSPARALEWSPAGEFAFLDLSAEARQVPCKAGDANCCGDTTCPFVNGVCCPGNGACCPEGSQCLPASFGQSGPMCAVVPPGWTYSPQSGGMLATRSCACPQTPCLPQQGASCPTLAPCCSGVEQMQRRLQAELQRQLVALQQAKSNKEAPPPMPAAWPRNFVSGQPEPLPATPAQQQLAYQQQLQQQQLQQQQQPDPKQVIQEIEASILARQDAAIAAALGQAAPSPAAAAAAAAAAAGTSGAAVQSTDPSKLPKISVNSSSTARVLSAQEAAAAPVGSQQAADGAAGAEAEQSPEEAVAGVSAWLRRRHPRGSVKPAVSPISAWIRRFRARHFTQGSKSEESSELSEASAQAAALANTIKVGTVTGYFSPESSESSSPPAKPKHKHKHHAKKPSASVKDAKAGTSGAAKKAAPKKSAAPSNKPAAKKPAADPAPTAGSDLGDVEDNVDAF